MGNGASKPVPADIDLLPPRFERKPTPLDRVALDPQEYLFGREKLDRLFTGFFAQPNGLSLRAALRPDYDEKASIVLSADASGKQKRPGSDQFALSLAYTEQATNPSWQGQVRLGSDGSMRGLVSSFDQVTGVGVYGLIPADYFLDRKYAPAAPTPTSTPITGQTAAAGGGVAGAGSSAQYQLGCGLGGPPVRYTHAHAHAASTGSSASAAVAISPRAVTSVPADAGSASSWAHAGQVRTVPEVGYRFINPQQTFSAGTHLGLAQPFPMKFWAVGRSGAGTGSTVTGGISLSTDNNRLTGAVGQAGEWIKARQAGQTELLAPGNPFVVDASLSVAETPTYEVSLSLDGHRREAVAVYVHTMTVRRKVYNPMEARHVKGMYNYVDLGIEFRRKLEPPFSATLAAAGRWQVNRNLLLCGRLGSRDVSASVALKTWTDPAVTLCATASWDRMRSSGDVGMFLSLEKGGAVEYSKAVAGAQTVVPSKALEARPGLNQRVTEEVDTRPFIEPPAARVSLDGMGSSPANRLL